MVYPSKRTGSSISLMEIVVSVLGRLLGNCQYGKVYRLWTFIYQTRGSGVKTVELLQYIHLGTLVREILGNSNRIR